MKVLQMDQWMGALKVRTERSNVTNGLWLFK